MPQWLGDFATWTGSIGTIAAFAVAYYQIHQERRHRLARELRDRIGARREHADRVSAWVSGSEVAVANRSGHPIHEVDVTLGTLRPGDDPHEESTSVHIVVVPPGEFTESLDDADGPPHVVRIAFTDSRADRWSRTSGEHPERIDPAD